MRKIFNASNLLGSLAVFAMILTPAAYEGELYITAVVLVVIFAISAYLSIKENGKK